jgi:phosphatidylglycerophosphate synthase
MSTYSDSSGVKVSFVAKVKTGFQMTAIIVLLAQGPDLSAPLVILGYLLLYVAAGLTLWSMYQYLVVAWPDLASGMQRQDKNHD